MGLGRQLRSASETDFFMKHLHRLFVLMLVFIVHDWFDLFGAALSIVVPTVVKLSQNPYTYKKEYAREFNFRDNADFVPVHAWEHMRVDAADVIRLRDLWDVPALFHIDHAGWFTGTEAVSVLLTRYANPGPMSPAMCMCVHTNTRTNSAISASSCSVICWHLCNSQPSAISGRLPAARVPVRLPGR